MSKATWENTVIAESGECIELEGNQYFPAESVKKEYLRESEFTSVCPWKGTASYYDVVVKGKTNKEAAWYYPNPSTAAQKIQGRIAFWKGVKVS